MQRSLMLSRGIVLSALGCFFVFLAIGQEESWVEQQLKKPFAIAGVEPVVAILDNGFNLEHSCLKDTWSSGGFDFVRDTNVVISKAHGTAMAGVITAECEDGLVEGVAKGVKCLPLVVDGGQQSVLEALRYVKQQKRLYVESDGVNGHDVYVVNVSLGLADDIDVKVLNRVIDSLGQLNVLTVVAAIDDVDDIWSKCKSEYLLKVAVVVDTAACAADVVCFKDEPLLALTEKGVSTQRGVSLYTAYVAGLATLPQKLSSERSYNALVIKESLLSGEGLFSLESYYKYLKTKDTFD